jgi:hypothetical protein
MRERGGAYRVLVGRHEGKRAFGRLGINGKIILNGSSRNRMYCCVP